MGRSVSALTALSEAALAATAKWWGGRSFEVQVREHRMTIDSAGREGMAAMEAVLAALASCLASMTAEILDAMKIPFDGLEVRAVGTERDEPPRTFRNVDVEVCLSRVNQERAERAVSLAESKYCPVSAILRQSGAELHVKTTIADALP